MYNNKEKKFHKELKNYLDEYYKKCKNDIVGHPQVTFFVNYYEDTIQGKSGSQIAFDLRGEEANFIRYPSRYQKCIPNFDESSKYVKREHDTHAIKVLVDIFRKRDELEKKYFK